MRRANGVVSAILTVLFLAHATAASAAMAFGLLSALSWVVWIGVGLIAVHVAMSVLTSCEQLTDHERPPSSRKKRHLALKWATGGVLAAVAIAHIVLPKSDYTAALLMAAIAVALAVHLCVGAKSLLKDIGVDRRYRMAFRIVVCAVLVAVAIVLLACLAMR